MKMALNEVVQLYTWRTEENGSCCSTVFNDRELGKKYVSPYRKSKQLYNSDKVLGSYFIGFKNYPTYNSNDYYNYEQLTRTFERSQEEKVAFVHLEFKVIRETLEKQLPFLKEITTFPENQYDHDNDSALLNKDEILNWLDDHEKKYGAEFDIKPADEVLEEDNPTVQTLIKIKENYRNYMIERGFPKKKCVLG